MTKYHQILTLEAVKLLLTCLKNSLYLLCIQWYSLDSLEEENSVTALILYHLHSLLIHWKWILSMSNTM